MHSSKEADLKTEQLISALKTTDNIHVHLNVTFNLFLALFLILITLIFVLYFNFFCPIGGKQNLLPTRTNAIEL
jgi:hypothetical protein